MGTHRRGYSVEGKGVSNAICEICRGKFKNYELKKRWDGLMVCEDDYETRHILDFYKQTRDSFPLPFIRKESNEGVDQVNATLVAAVTPTLGAWTLLPYDTEVSDRLTEFTLGTDTFRASAGGNYAITVACAFNLAGLGAQYGLAIYKNGSELVAKGPYTNITPSVNYIQFTSIQTLLSTDDITVKYYITGTNSTLPATPEATFINVRLVT